MKSRFRRAIVWLVAVLVAYTSYAVLAVPFLEPSVELATVTHSNVAPRPTQRRRDFADLFDEDAWELQRPKVLETDRGTVIFDDYKQLPDKQSIQLNRCSLVYYTGRRDDSSRRAIVLRAPQGAVLYFDGELNIPRGEFGRLIGGELSGNVTMYSPPSQNGNDRLQIETRDIRIEERRIWTPHDVAFRYGPNSGSGGDLSVTLHPPASRAEEPRGDSRLGRIESLELVRVDEIKLQLPNAKLPLGNEQQGTSTQEAAGATTVDINCRGPLRFDFDANVLSLNDHVDVIRHNAEGPSDQLNCQQLRIHFLRPDISPVAANERVRLKLQRIVAMGLPVTLRLASMEAFARGEQLEFNFVTQRVWMQDPQGVVLRDDRYEVTSTEIEYELGKRGRLGRLWAAGPGKVTGRLGKQRRRFAASWEKEVRLQPFRGSKVLSLIDAAHIELKGTGNVAAEQLHFFLAEQPRPNDPGRFTIVPDRMKAVGDVHFDSPRLAGNLDEAQLWFVADKSAGNRGARTAEERPNRLAGRTPPLFERLPADDASWQKLNVDAEQLNAELQLGESIQIVQLAAKGGVRCEDATAAAAKRISVNCDVFQLLDGNTNDPVAMLTGQPARISAEGATVVGKEITVRQGSNTAEIRGSGAMTLPRPNQPNQPWQVQWKRRMQFNGRQAQFFGEVVAGGTQSLQKGQRVHFQAQGKTLRVALTRFLDFNDTNNTSDVDLRELAFAGACSLDSQTIGSNGRRRSKDTLRVNDLTLNQSTGRIHGDGPGWLRSVHYGEELFREGELSEVAKGLNLLRVEFQRELVGNLNVRQMEFLGDVRTVYGPVSSWDDSIDATSPSGLRPRDVMVTSQRLAVADMGQTRDRFGSVELEATGNAFVRGQSFTASGRRISYVRAKDQLVLEGDGRNHAVLTYQRTPGATPAPLKARKILFWPQTKQFELNDFHSLELDNLSQFRQRPQ